MRFVVVEKAYRAPRTTVPLRIKSKGGSTKPKSPKIKKRKGRVGGAGIGTGQSF